MSSLDRVGITDYLDSISTTLNERRIMQGQLTSRERVKAALSHQEVDRTPVFEYVLLSPVADQLLGRKYGGDPANWQELLSELGWEKAVRRSAVDQLELALRLGHDLMYVLPNPAPPEAQQPPGGIPDDQESDPVERVRRRNSWTEEHYQEPHEDHFLIYQILKQEMQARGVDLPLLAPAYAHGIWTDVDLMQTLILEPEVAQKHFALATQDAMGYVQRYLEAGIELIGVGGDFAGNRPLISPALYQKYIVPEVRRMSRNLHEAGAWAINASDGNLWSVIEDFLLGCEVDGYLEIDAGAGMDLVRLKKLYGDRITFFGNLDCGNLLSFSPIEEIQRQTIECIQAGWGNGGHILCAGNAITASIPLKNYLAVVETYREYFHLPPLELA